MLANKQLTMRHLLDSKNGIHLTAYLNNKLGDPETLQSQFNAILKCPRVDRLKTAAKSRFVTWDPNENQHQL